MTQAALLLAALIAAPPPEPTPTAAPPAAVARAPTLVVRARGLDERALAAALRPRSGGADVVLLRDVASVDPDHTFVDVELQAGELAVTVILRDGRVFVRRGPGGGPRDAARLCASMLAAIADDALAPLPERAASPALAAAPSEQVPEDMSEEPAEPAVPAPPERSADPPQIVPVAPVLEPAPQDMSLTPAADDLVEPAPPERPKPAAKDRRPTLSLGLAGGPLFGLGPDAGVRGGGGEVRVDLRGPRVWLVSAGVRAAGHSLVRPGMESREERFGLARVRVSLGAGAWLTRGRFELRATANLSVEPWFVTHVGRRVSFGESTDPAPLLGGHIRIAPTFAVTRWLDLGAFAEVAASATPTGNAVRVRLGDTRIFSAGGVEASLGLELRARAWPKQTKPR
ncbi:hypothetical protein [Nannocystis punicea]|uniref:Uncharacterized protein n=1 Tax=Nannocystis punicea TaxID=2995304 RepID=A0ABY7HC49_9BACT|nr:hypothetical protein [Nannocystis poenicansa]WAS96861.1 hypothetical protein O0S08_11995 [Nannocystis poenicansa]